MEEFILEEGKKYVLGKEYPFGRYFIISKNEDLDATVHYKDLYYAKSFSRSYKMYFGMIMIDSKYSDQIEISVENGIAIYAGNDTYENVLFGNLQTDLNKYIYYHNELLDDSNLLYWGDFGIGISQRHIIEIGSHKYFTGIRKFYTYHSVDDETYNLKIGKRKKQLHGKNHSPNYSLKIIDFNNGFCLSNEDKYYVFQILNQNYGMFMFKIEDNTDISDITITSIKTEYYDIYKLTRKKIERIYKNDWYRLKNLLIKAEERANVKLDIQKEYQLIMDIPDYMNLVSDFLEKTFEKFDCIDRHEYPDTFTFHVDASYKKKFYVAAKLAKKAIRITRKNEPYIFYVTFSKSQVEEISLMYYNMSTYMNEDKDYMQEIYNFLIENSFSDFLRKEILDFYHSSKYSFGTDYSFFENHILANLKKAILQSKNNRTTKLYEEMKKEGRVITQWSSEYRLYSYIKKYVPNVEYQYSPKWLNLQSLDIYLPGQAIAIEYQGEQHYQAIDIYGGEQKYLENLERDKRKLDLCNKNGIQLLEWKHDQYVKIESVKEFLKKNNISIIDIKNEITDLTYDEALDEMAPILNKVKSQKGKHIPQKEKHSKMKRNSKVIRQYDFEGVFIAQYESISEACNKTGIRKKAIEKVIYGERKSTANYMWRRCDASEEVKNIEPYEIKN